MRKSLTLLTLLFSIFCQGTAQSLNNLDSLLANSRQLLHVETSSISATHGTMNLYERKNEHKRWKLVSSFRVMVGRTGMARDPQNVLQLADTMPVKHEGDGKSPAGIFQLGAVFSYHDLEKLHMPFVRVDTTDLCVDDENSAYYNTLIRSDSAKHDYKSFEYMKRRDSLYEYGVWVLYNSLPVIPGNGSCIFIHVWRDENSPTAGCTAMSRENILKLIYRLDKKKNPLLVQVVNK
jgi:D-alanyl-D-alanine dipeptidase